MRWKTVAQTSGCNRKRSVTDSGQTSKLRRTSRDVDEAEERSRRLASVSAGRRSSPRMYVDAGPTQHNFRILNSAFEDSV